MRVTVFPSRDELDILEALIVSNWQRGRNNVEIGREGAAMYEIAAERGKVRQATLNNNAKSLGDQSPQAKGDHWRARDEIAKRCGVTHTYVNTLRSLETVSSDSEQRTYTTKHGTPAVMNTANIGRNGNHAPAPITPVVSAGCASGVDV